MFEFMLLIVLFLLSIQFIAQRYYTLIITAKQIRPSWLR